MPRGISSARTSASGEGPCVDAFVLDARVKTDDLRVEARWPALRAQLRDAADPRRARAADAPGRAGRDAQRLLRAAAQCGTRARSRLSRRTTTCSRRASAARSSHRAWPHRRPAPVRPRQPRHDRARDRPAHGPRRRRRPDGVQRAAAHCAQLAPARRRRSPRSFSPRTRASGRLTPGPGGSDHLGGLPRLGRSRAPRRRDGLRLRDRLDRTRPRARLRRSGSTSAKASSRPSTKARIGNDGDQRVERAVRDDVVREVAQPHRRAGAMRADREREQRPRRERAARSSGTLSMHARPADAAELVEDARDEPGAGDQRRALPETTALGRSRVVDEQEQRRCAGQSDESRECALHAATVPCAPRLKRVCQSAWARE